jgi:hypothetical protein
MSRTLRRAIGLALATGVIAGLVVTIAVPRTRATARAARSTDYRHPRIGRATRPPTGPGYITFEIHGRPRVEERTPDSLGGPPWAVRVMSVTRVDRFPQNGSKHPRVIGHSRCAQLGRLLGGRFGWIDASNTFHAVLADPVNSPLWCKAARKPWQPYLQLLTRITDPNSGTASPVQSVTWGITGSRGKLMLRLGKRTVSAEPSPDGVFIALGGPSLRSGQVSGTLAYPDGRTVAVAPTDERTPPNPKAVVDLRVPDPDGGLPFGILVAPSNDGQWCTLATGRVVGNEVGQVDYAMGTFEEISGNFNQPNCPPPNSDRRSPLRFGFGLGESAPGEEGGSSPELGRIARRTLPGLFEISGVAAPDVRQITIASPRDVRTLIPSSRAHAFLALYDGSFPTGNIILTSTLANGSTHRDVIPGGLP